jgi:uncharacterized membrane protein (DUF2068 family)
LVLNEDSARSRGGGDAPVVLIGVFRLLKASVLFALGVGALLGIPEQIAASIALRVGWTGAFSGGDTVHRAVAKVLSMDEATIRRIGAVSIAYAAVFTVEGIGLVERKTWAEWFTVVITGSFIPIELYEVARHVDTTRLIALALNVLIVGYLAWRRVRLRADGASRNRR